jgi:hypothetical protein
MISVVVWLGMVISGVDLFENFVNTLEGLERFEIDEIMIAVVIFGVFAFLDLIRRHRIQKVELEKAKIYQAMLFSTHHNP